MTEQDVKNQITKALREVTDKLGSALDPVGEPPKPENSEGAQRIHEAALKEFNTAGGVSLNSAATKAALEDLLKQKPKQ